MNEWKPIDTLLKTPFDVLGTDGRWVGMMGWSPIRNGEYGWVTPTGYQVEPTHWMDMPKPPQMTIETDDRRMRHEDLTGTIKG